jgi:hypothetical protein
MPGQILVPKTSVTLPTAPVAPAGAPDGQTCTGTTVIGALNTATGGSWNGVWSDTTGWSIESIKGLTANTTTGRHWDVYLNDHYLNDSVCQKQLSEGDRLLLFPRCTTGLSPCYSGYPLILQAPTQAGPGVQLSVQVWEIVTSFDLQGVGESTVRAVENATVTSPDGRALTDPYGVAAVPVNAKGDNTVSVAKGTDVPDRTNVCITDGSDGYCGTTVPPTNPFDPYAFCQTTGFDGYCNSPDQVPPVGHIAQPVQGQSFTKATAPKLFKGTVDFDPTQTDSVRLRLMRQATVTRYKIKKRRVTVKRKVRGKTVRKKVVKKIRKPYKAKACFYWSVSTSTWKSLKRCDASTAPTWKADGADEWSYEFLNALPTGSYTVDALAKDGAGNVDAVPEIGRNRVTFKVT